MEKSKMTGIIIACAVVAVVVIGIAIFGRGGHRGGSGGTEKGGVTSLGRTGPGAAEANEGTWSTALPTEAGKEPNAGAEAMGQPARGQMITVVVKDYPAGVAKGGLSAVYMVGTKRFQFKEGETAGQMMLAGADKLGGELVVYQHVGGQPQRAWAYIRNVRKNKISLPEDADMVVTGDKLISAYLSFRQEDRWLLINAGSVAFYASQESALPLFYAALKDAAGAAVDYEKAPVQIVPGRYFMRLIISKDGQETSSSLGWAEVTGEPGRTYTAEFPYK